MMKHELESRLGYEITDDGFKLLEQMYMATELNKDDFTELVRTEAKKFKKEQPIKEIRYAKYPWQKTPNGCWYVGVKVGQVIGINYKKNKLKVKFLRNSIIGDIDSYYGAEYSEDQIMEVK